MKDIQLIDEIWVILKKLGYTNLEDKKENIGSGTYGIVFKVENSEKK